MRFSLAFLWSATLLSSCWAWGKHPWCLDDYNANLIANEFAQLISNFSVAAAELVLAPDFSDQSDSVNTLINGGGTSPLPLGSVTFPTKAAFIAGQGSQPDVPFTILNTWHTCDTVIIRWVINAGPQQVQGFDAFIVEPSSDPRQKFQIQKSYGEFNSGAWLADLGHPECGNGTAAKRR